MAQLPRGKDGSEWVIQDIGDDVCIIQYPGRDEETVHWRYDGRSRTKLTYVKDEVFKSKRVTDEQKFYIAFWMGYFYAHMR